VFFVFAFCAACKLQTTRTPIRSPPNMSNQLNLFPAEPGPLTRVLIGDSRRMVEVADESTQLVVTSPPYWQLKDYGTVGQIGYGQSLHEYLRDLFRVWSECARALQPGRRLCINIGDQFARQSVYGRYKVIPLHAEIISQCEILGLDYMGSILWQKRTTMETSGGAVVMGSYPHPPNGIVEIDYEYILIFKKPGLSQPVERAIKEAAALTRDEWKECFSGHWRFAGARQHLRGFVGKGHEAMFPEELPRRLIRMFSFPGETVLDPFLGSGVTAKVARDLGRKSVGYEINEMYLPLIQEKLCAGAPDSNVEIIYAPPSPHGGIYAHAYTPRIQDARPLAGAAPDRREQEPIYRVAGASSADTLRLECGTTVQLAGLKIERESEALDYLRNRVVGRQVYVRTVDGCPLDSGSDHNLSWVYLKNRIFVNGHLVRSGMAMLMDDTLTHWPSRRKRRDVGALDSNERAKS